MEMRELLLKNSGVSPHFLILRNARVCGSNVNSGFTLLQYSFSVKRKQIHIELFVFTFSYHYVLNSFAFTREFINTLYSLYLNFSKHIFCFLFVF